MIVVTEHSAGDDFLAPATQLLEVLAVGCSRPLVRERAGHFLSVAQNLLALIPPADGAEVRAAVAAWAKTLSVELAPHGITVNNVLPGATDTDRMAEIIAGKSAKSGKSEAEVTAEADNFKSFCASIASN